MNKWALEQKKEAFNYYRKIVAMGLHFKEGSDYSYVKYNGATNVSFENFIKKDTSHYVRLKNKIKNLDLDRFLFANFLAGFEHVYQLNSEDALENYKVWENEYGTSENFYENCQRKFSTYRHFNHNRDRNDSICCDVVDFIRDHVGRFEDHEILIWIMRKFPETKKAIKELHETDLFSRMILDRTSKIYEFYEWLCIL